MVTEQAVACSTVADSRQEKPSFNSPFSISLISPYATNRETVLLGVTTNPSCSARTLVEPQDDGRVDDQLRRRPVPATTTLIRELTKGRIAEADSRQEKIIKRLRIKDKKIKDRVIFLFFVLSIFIL